MESVAKNTLRIKQSLFRTCFEVSTLKDHIIVLVFYIFRLNYYVQPTVYPKPPVFIVPRKNL
uniref:Uncharacterized protein n=1 Tax=Setaria italica TaxID=4555 RepID=K3ZYW0_SETIT